MSKLKILVNFQFMKWFHAWIEIKKSEMDEGEHPKNK